MRQQCGTYNMLSLTCWGNVSYYLRLLPVFSEGISFHFYFQQLASGNLWLHAWPPKSLKLLRIWKRCQRQCYRFAFPVLIAIRINGSVMMRSLFHLHNNKKKSFLIGQQSHTWIFTYVPVLIILLYWYYYVSHTSEIIEIQRAGTCPETTELIYGQFEIDSHICGTPKLVLFLLRYFVPSLLEYRFTFQGVKQTDDLCEYILSPMGGIGFKSMININSDNRMWSHLNLCFLRMN